MKPFSHQWSQYIDPLGKASTKGSELIERRVPESSLFLPRFSTREEGEDPGNEVDCDVDAGLVTSVDNNKSYVAA